MNLRRTTASRPGASRPIAQSWADDLEALAALHGAEMIAAVIVEPVAGSTGVLPPPAGYLGRLRSVCDRHVILLIFDEVITGFGRLGAPFAVDRFGGPGPRYHRERADQRRRSHGRGVRAPSRR